MEWPGLSYLLREYEGDDAVRGALQVSPRGSSANGRRSPGVLSVVDRAAEGAGEMDVV